MDKLLIKYLSVYLSAALKFVGGIIVGTVEELNFVEIAVFTFLGSMTTISVLTFFGNRYRKRLASFFYEARVFFFKFKQLLKPKKVFSNRMLREKIIELSKPKKFSKTSRLAVKAWNKMGLWGIAILTPLLISPIGGALLAVSFRVRTRKVIVYMAIVHAVAAIVFAFAFVEFKDFIQDHLGIQLKKHH
jgi:hypothetical protein